MLVQDWMTRSVVTVDEETPITKASIVMKEKQIRCLPVTNKRGKLVGIITDGDVKAASPSKATSLDVYELNYLLSTLSVKEIMTKKIVFARPDETVEFAAVLMLENKVASLPVLDERDNLVGIITQTDVLKVLINIAGIYSGGIQFGFSLEDRPGSIKEVADTIRSHGGRIVSILSTREMVQEGRRNVYIRTGSLPGHQVRSLTNELEKKFVVLYSVHDIFEEVERRRVRIAY